MSVIDRSWHLLFYKHVCVAPATVDIADYIIYDISQSNLSLNMCIVYFIIPFFGLLKMISSWSNRSNMFKNNGWLKRRWTTTTATK